MGCFGKMLYCGNLPRYEIIMSNSLRVSSALFEAAASAGAALDRSTAQQVEHWARLGRALEQRGLTVDNAIALLNATAETEESLWAHKRRLQARDVARVRSGRAHPSDLSIFAPGMAKRAKVLNGPY